MSLKEASFRGVPFYVESFDEIGGQVLNIQELPNQDRGVIQTMGLKTTRFSINAYVTQRDSARSNFHRDATLWKNELISAFQNPDPGILELSYLKSRLSVYVGAFKIKGDLSTKISISVEMVVNLGRAALVTQTERKISILEKTTAMFNTFSSYLNESLFIDPTAAYLLQDLNNVYSAAFLAVDAVYGRLQFPTDQLAKVDSGYRKMRGSSDFNVFFDFLNSIVSSDVEGDVSGAFLDLINFDYAPINLGGSPSSTALKSASNVDVLSSVMRFSFIGSAAASTKSIVFQSRNEAVEYRSALSDISSQYFGGVPLEVFESVSDVINEAAGLIQEQITNLAPLATFSADEELPVEFLSWLLYGDVNRSAELLRLNNVPDGLFMPRTFEAFEW